VIELDLTAYSCPMPLIKLKKALAEYPDVLEFKLLLTDKGSLKDVPAFCKQMNLRCEADQVGENLVIWVGR